MKRWITPLFDTLPKRLAWLMWVTLVVSHMLAFGVVMGTRSPNPAHAHPASGAADPEMPPMARPGLPVFPSLPPMGALGQGQGLPWSALALDYGVRLLVIGLAAWLGGRWLSGPLRRLGSATAQLGEALRAGRPAPQIEHRSGTREVQQLATDFNAMAAQLQQQFEARALMMAAISHDLRTPLTRLRMRLETQADGERLREQAVADVAEMNELIDTALSVFRPRSATAREHLQTVDLQALLQAVVDDAADLGQAVSLTADQGDGGSDWRVSAHPLALRRVLDNLMGNALRYGDAARLHLHRVDGAVRVDIEDDGPGIDPDLLEAVFEPFVRADSSRHRARGGAGLGLYIARQLAQDMGVSLRLHNREGGGLQAQMRWPA